MKLIRCNCATHAPELLKEWDVLDHNIQAFKNTLIELEKAGQKNLAYAMNDEVLTVPQQVQGMAPSSRHREIISSKRPIVNLDQMMVVTWVASHNLMSHSMGVWDLESLYAMAERFPAGMGKPLQCDHEWYEMDAVKGFIFDSRLIRSNQAPDEVISGQPDFVDINNEIVSEQGYYSLELDTAIPIDSEFGRAVASGLAGDCSTGGLRDSVFYCPICTKSQGKPIDFFEDADICPHIPPLPYMSWFYDFSDPEIKKILAPYYIRGGFKVAIELSAVVTGDLPGAQILYSAGEAASS
jgi:hypothetical protein